MEETSMAKITVLNGEITEKEKQAYIQHIKEDNPGKELRNLTIKLDGDFVDLEYDFEPVKFQRIRRITGYLVGDMTRWNDAKTAEERDRVKHTI